MSGHAGTMEHPAVVTADLEPVEYGLLAEFDNPGALMHAAEKVRDAGYTKWDCHTPFPVHGLDKSMGIRMTKLPIFVFFCGLTGATLGVALQWFTNASDLTLYAPMEVVGYPYPISGKPLWSLPANIPVIFELTILLSAFGAVFGMLGLNGLPRLYHPLFTSARFRRVTNDRFFIVIETADGRFDRQRTEGLLRDAGATHIEVIED
ncbi:MAG: DUF3341 domain-containing protein [Phycisphaerales bacterium]